MCVILSTVNTPLQVLLWNLKTNDIVNVFNMTTNLEDSFRVKDIQISSVSDLFCVLGNDNKVRILDSKRGQSSTDLVFDYGAIASPSKFSL